MGPAFQGLVNRAAWMGVARDQPVRRPLRWRKSAPFVGGQRRSWEKGQGHVATHTGRDGLLVLGRRAREELARKPKQVCREMPSHQLVNSIHMEGSLLL